MKVTVNASGRVVEIESNEADMTVHRLANIAINTWKRTEPDGEDLGPAYGFTSQLNAEDPFPWSRRLRLAGGAPLDAS